ncbi:hypothetical protein CLOBOL_00585 [Enterocloster bolteae ATCC BAA-613]|uniref:Uncharacterized protein n=1 Tax=Enterocloster bolteae (strain ATCC BAA-613 / DSM 15670 / CCUG 46953 / JCM 12243 / WAL 16351) TaxID=411902 RepID=A8RI38_ENTBW|nr:hypothetical protein CLOBOL_00585 [Enterocloster bolteae ATCC BAA-613]
MLYIGVLPIYIFIISANCQYVNVFYQQIDNTPTRGWPGNEV